MKKWSEVAQSKEYQGLASDQKEAARNQYFSEVIAPQVPEDQRAAAKSQFDADTSMAHDASEYEAPVKTALKKGVGYLAKQKKAGEEMLGAVAEPILQQATGMVAKPISEIAGLAATGYEMATGGKDAENIPGFQRELQEKLTYQPKTEAGASPYNPLTAIPMAIGKGIAAITPEKAAPGEATTATGILKNIASEAVPQAVGLAGAKIAPKAAAPVAKAAKTLRTGAEDLMQSALKPTPKDLISGKAAQAIDTMLEKGIPATPKGVEQIRARIDELNDQIRTAIANSPERVETAKLARPVVEKLRDFRKQVNQKADVDAIKNSWAEFKSHPFVKGDALSVQAAQELKQGTYKQLSKKYGQLGSAEVEAQKAIARGLKEQVAAKVPEIVPLNLEESKLFNVLSVAERRIVMEANKNPMGLSLLTKDPKAWAAFMADRSASAKSLLARIMNRASKKLSGAAESGKAERATTAGAVVAPAQTEREKRKQYEMGQYREPGTKQ